MSLRNQERPHLPLRAIAFGCGGAFLFTMQDAIFKWYSQDYAIIQIIFLRSFLALLISAAWVWRHGGKAALRVPHPKLLLLSIIANVIAWYCFYSALSMMPLTIAICIFFLTPVFIALAAVPLLREPLTWRQIGALFLGFGGVWVITDPLAEVAPVAPFAVALILVSVVMWGSVAIITRALESSITVGCALFYNNISFLIFSFGFQSMVWTAPSAIDWVGMISLGALGVLAQACMFAAYRSARAAVATTAEYSALIWALLLGWLLWDERLDTNGIIGAALIICAGLVVISSYRRSAAKKIILAE